MGLLDYLFDPTTYGGQGGLLAGLSQNITPIAPSQGFSPTLADRFQPAIDQPLGPPPTQQTLSSRFQPAVDNPLTPIAPSISVGNYQMPRLGNMADYTPQQTSPAALPPNAQPAQGQLPVAPQQTMPQPNQPLPPALGGQPGGMNGALQGFMANAGNGPIGMLLGSIGGAMGMESPRQQNLKAQFDSLRTALEANGEKPQAAASKAMVAVMNPEAAKTIIPELFTNKEDFGVVRDDPLTGKQYGFINKRDQTINGKPINAQATVSSSPLADLEAARASGVTGDALYGYLPPGMRSTVQAMVEGRQPLPSTAAMRSPAILALIDAAHSVDPTFDATSWGTRVAGQKDFYGGGKSSEIMRKANQSALHFGELVSDKMSELPGHTMPAANAVANFVNTNLLGKGAQGNFMVNAHALADELAGLFKGANLSDTEIRAWESRLTPDMSVEQQRGMAKALLGLYRDSVAALEKKRTESIGAAAAEKKGPILGPEAEAALSGVEKFANGGERAAQTSAGVDRSAIEAEMKRRGLLK